MPNLDEFSERELEILQLIATGASNKEIASMLHISSNTVKVHLRNIFTKIDVTTRTEAAMYAVSHRLVKDLNPSISADTDEIAENLSEQLFKPELLMQTSPGENAKNRIKLILSGVAALLLLVVGFIILNSIRPSDNQLPQSLEKTPTIEKSNLSILPPLFEPRYGFALVVYDNHIYTIGGITDQGISDSVNYYDPFSARWKKSVPKPQKVANIQAGVISGKIYVPGGTIDGSKVTDRLDIFDPIQNVWTQGSPLPVPLSSYGLATFDGSLYLFGGWDGARVVNTAYKYDPADDLWIELPAMPTGRQDLGAAVAGRKIYVIGGRDQNGPLASNEVFSPDQINNPLSIWQIAPPLPEPVYGMGVGSVADILYIVGGLGEEDQTPQRYPVLAYDSVQGWRNIQEFSVEPAAFSGFTSYGKYLYMAGGLLDQNLTDQFLQYQAVFTISFPIIIQ